MPTRIQRRRNKGWRMPQGAVYVGRPTRWGNPFMVGEPYAIRGTETWTVRDRAHAVALYRDYLAARPGLAERARVELAGRDLACWCPLDQPCHGDVLLEIAGGAR
ncbi:DUF4326 domain-containing protein [Klebsiella pneumoniae]|nr:DUF4326 domain-containing protein [Klebsiella pneumoniae]